MVRTSTTRSRAGRCTPASSSCRPCLRPTYIKLTWGPFLQRYTEFLLRAEGLETQKWQPAIPGTGHSSRLRFNDFLNSYGWTIAGGSNEIMRNIIAERILGMPKG